MTARTDPARKYTSAVREATAQQTRDRIVAAASTLFTRDGYGATTIDAIAAEAGVGRKTVFDAVGGKPVLLKQAYDVATVGDSRPVALAQRPEIARLQAETDPAARLRGYAALVVNIAARIHGIFRAVEGAAGTDPDVRAFYDAMITQRRQAMNIPARLMADEGRLRTGLDAERAADLLFVFNDPMLYDKFVVRLGWPVADFESWLAATMIEQLLEPPS